MKEPKIKPQLKLLVLNYLGKCNGNIKKSALEAGYSETYAEKQAYKLLWREDVKQYMEYIRDKNSVELDIANAQDVQKFWTNIMNNENVQTKDRLRASENLAKAQGLFSNEW